MFALTLGAALAFASAVRQSAPGLVVDIDSSRGFMRPRNRAGDRRCFKPFPTLDEPQKSTCLPVTCSNSEQLPVRDKLVVSHSRQTTNNRYTTKSIWLSSLRNIGGSQVLRNVMQPLLAVTSCAILVASVHLVTGKAPIGRASKALAQMHSLLGGALSLLLVFRTNAAYNRFWEARKIWEKLLNRCRDLARHVCLFETEVGAARVSLLATLLCAFPRELRAHLVGRSQHEEAGNGRASGATIMPLPPSLSDALVQTTNRPLRVCKWMGSELKQIPDSPSGSYTSRERLASITHVNQLSSYIGACERLLQTPVPLNYARHTSRFLTLWCLTLPISLVESMGPLVVPVCAFVTWCLFGIQEIGLFIEHCALDDGSVFMDKIARRVAVDVREELRTSAFAGQTDDAALLEQARRDLDRGSATGADDTAGPLDDDDDYDDMPVGDSHGLHATHRRQMIRMDAFHFDNMDAGMDEC